jgi:hypothetical protein
MLRPQAMSQHYVYIQEIRSFFVPASDLSTYSLLYIHNYILLQASGIMDLYSYAKNVNFWG